MGGPGAWALWAYGPRGQIGPQGRGPQGPGDVQGRPYILNK